MPATLLERIKLELTIDTNAYSSGDVVGGLLTLSSLTQVWVRGAILNRICLVDQDNKSAVFDLRLFESAPTSIANNAAFAPTQADLRAMITKIAIAATNYTSVNSMARAEVAQINGLIPPNGGDLYAYLTLNGSTPTWTHTKAVWIALDFYPQSRDD